MRYISLLLLLTLLAPSPSASCVQSYGTTLAGEVIEMQGDPPIVFALSTDSSRREIRDQAARDALWLDSLVRVEGSIESRNDLAVALMRLARPEEALAL